MKVSHHGSKHGTALEMVERLSPKHVAISCGNPSEYGFPHDLTVGALTEIRSTIKHSYEGTIIYGIESDGTPLQYQYTDQKDDLVPAPTRI